MGGGREGKGREEEGGWEGGKGRGGREEGGGRYLFGIMKAYLPGSHGGCFVEVGPGGVDYCYVIFFVAWVGR